MEKISIDGQKSENLDPNYINEKNELALIELRILNRELPSMTLNSRENISMRNIATLV